MKKASGVHTACDDAVAEINTELPVRAAFDGRGQAVTIVDEDYGNVDINGW